MADLLAPETKASAAVNTARASMPQLAPFRAPHERSFEQEAPPARSRTAHPAAERVPAAALRTFQAPPHPPAIPTSTKVEIKNYLDRSREANILSNSSQTASAEYSKRVVYSFPANTVVRTDRGITSLLFEERST